MMSSNRSFLITLIAIPVAVALVSLISISVIISSSKAHVYENAADAPKAEAALILGAGVLKNGGLSPVLKDRVDEAIELYQEGKVQQVIASGNRSLEYNEVDPIAAYLESHDIPESAILTDYAGFDTYSSIYRARDIFGVHSVLIVTQSFHLPRAIFIARNLGLEASGVSADRGHYKLGNYFREMLADMKAVINLMFERKPESVQAKTTEEDATGYLFPMW
jgi:SanA protein